MGFSDRASSIPLSLLILSLLLQTTISIDPLFTICSNSQNYTANSPYEINLKISFSQLYVKTPPTGFGLASFGQPDTRAYSLALCRSDVPIKDCAICVGEASSAITSRCPNNKGAVIWYDNCYIKYSDDDFFGKIDDQNKFYMWNLRNVSDNNGDEFNQKTRDLLSGLAEEASDSKKMFANGEVEIGEEKIYGMAQCSRDLSKSECKKCVADAVSDLPLCCDDKVGGRVVGGSCGIRYEIYPFLNL